MRRAYFDSGWLKDEKGRLMGIALGYDRCGEHELGVDGICAAFGLSVPAYPEGVKDRTVKLATERLVFAEFKLRPKADRRRKAFDVAMLLFAPRRWGGQPRMPEEWMSRASCSFDIDPGDRWHRPENDLVTSYDSDGFCIVTRGTENIANLRRLREAFQALDVAIGLPWSKGFVRGGLSLVMVGQMSATWKREVLERDLAFRELHEAAEATGIFDILAKAGKKFHACSPDWFDREAKGEVIFFLNPCDQRRYDHGWFTVDELTDWARDRGPVMKDARLDEFEARPENYDHACRLLRGLNKRGLGLRYHAKLVWFDAQKEVPGLRLRMSKGSDQSVLADGVHAFADVMDRFADPLAVAGASTT